jgi:hypothetical protein
MIKSMLRYFYTKYGDVYAGYESNELDFPDHTIIIQGTKLKDYMKLSSKEKSFEKVSEYGWIVLNSTITNIFDSNKFNPQKTYRVSDTWYGDYDRKYLFIIGAGASAHCVYGKTKEQFYKDNLRPPLGTSLFEKRFENYHSKYDGVKELLRDLDSNVNVDIEALFETEWKESKMMIVGSY